MQRPRAVSLDSSVLGPRWRGLFVRLVERLARVVLLGVVVMACRDESEHVVVVGVRFRILLAFI